MKIGISGLSQSGKTAVFDALCPHHQETHVGAARMEVRRGIVKIPEPRLEKLAAVYHPQKISYAEIEFMDVAAMSGKIGDATRSAREIPPALREAEVLAHVVRAFDNDLVVHPQGSINALRDIQNIEAELIFNDLLATETRLEKVSRQARLADDEKARREQAVLEKIKFQLEAEKPLRALKLTADERKLIKGFQFLSQKPKLIIINVDEKDIPRMDKIAAEYAARIAGPEVEVVPLCAKIQAELAQLGEEDRLAFMQDLGLSESALDQVIRKAFALLGLVTFFTGGEKEVHAWPIPKGAKAPQAAGTIHEDFEKGFIKAEVYYWEDLVKYGSEAEARKHGCLRLEGKDYEVREGDTILFRFNI